MVKPSKFEITVQVSGDEGRVTVEGDLDMATAPRLDGALQEALQLGAGKVTIDLGAVTFVDSSGLRALIAMHRQSQDDDWELRILRPGEGAFTVFQISGADQALPFAEG
jgi:anti-anti-sigma factor